MSKELVPVQPLAQGQQSVYADPPDALDATAPKGYDWIVVEEEEGDPA